MSALDILTGCATFLLLLPVAFAQSPPSAPSEREKSGLRGAVKTSVTETPFYSAERTIVSIEKIEYTPDGRLLRRSHAYDQNPEWVSLNTYDAAGRLVETISGSADIPIGERTHKVYTYDKDGHRTGAHSGTQAEIVERVDESGHRIEIQHYPDLSNRPDAAIGSPMWEESGLGMPTSSGGRFETYYNDRGVPFEGRVFDRNGQEIAYVVRTFDAKGRPSRDELTSHASSAGLPGELASQLNPEQQKSFALFWASQLSGFVTYKYDNQGRLIERRKSGNMIGDEITTFEYDKHGSKVLERTATAPSAAQGTEYGMTEAGQMVPTKQSPATPPQTSETRIEYVYDENGNWIEQKVKASWNGQPSPSPDQVIKRTLTYF
jgi:hypothetical protein